MPAPLVAGAIAAGAGLVGKAVDAFSAGKMNKRAEKFARESMHTQRQWALDDWNMQNAYNDPLAQMQRLKNANLNPHLVYGNGADAQSTSPVRQTQSHQPSYETPKVGDVGSVLMNAMQMKQIQSNIARTDAETNAINEKTTAQQFQNQLNQTIGIDKMVDRYGWATDKLATESARASAEYDAWQAAGFSGMETKDPNSPIAKAYRAGWTKTLVELENAKKLGDLRSAEAAIKEFSANLARQGIDPNTPWYVKLIVDIVSAATGTSINSLLNPVNIYKNLQ